MGRYRVAADVGGTFTDIVCFDLLTGELRADKVPTTPGDLSVGIFDAVARGVSNLTDIDFFVHGTTAGLNAFLERRGSAVALVTTAGFRDVYEIGRANRPDMYNLHYRKPTPLVLRRHIYEVPERVLFDGSVEVPLDESGVEAIAEAIRRADLRAVAVCLLHAYVNPVHELRVGEILRRVLPDAQISLSHAVAREWREYERTSSTVVNAYIAPVMERYLDELERGAEGRFGPIHIMQSNGGVMTSQVARGKPVQTLFSGPIGGAIGVSALCATVGSNNLIGIDMGGTSFDVSLVLDGAAEVTTQIELQGHPILAPMVRIHTVGAGGGSIAWLEGGGLRVGPRSAGAQPGPACYGRGGTQPTVTDANLVLGRVDPEFFLGGRMALDAGAARQVLRGLGDQLGLGSVELAQGICAVVNANMANAIRQITVEQGVDPRDFKLVAFGGAGPMHAVFLAEELEIDTVVVPNSPGTFSASGMLRTDIQHDVVQSLVRRVARTTSADLHEAFRDAEERAERLLAEDGIPASLVQFNRMADMRYVGQEYTVRIGFPDNRYDDDTLARMPELFHRAHHTRYGHSNPVETVEFVTVRVTAVGKIEKPLLEVTRNGQARAHPQPSPATRRQVVFDGRQLDTPVYRRDDLLTGQTFVGPAIVEETSCTSVISPHFQGAIDPFGNLIIQRVRPKSS